jgi:Mce-associated membrane protein
MQKSMELVNPGTTPEADHSDGAGDRERRGGRNVPLRSVVIGGLVAVLVVALAVLGWQLRSTTHELDQLHDAAASTQQAERIALDYATGAAEMDFRDLPAWRTRLTAGTSPELSNRLTQAATSMEQIIAPLQWTSTAQPISAKAEPGPDGTYSVDCFVSVLTKNSQAPDGLQSTATYKMTVDSGNEWKITEISGIDSALDGDTAPR